MIDILKKILILFFVAIATGLGFSIIVGSFCLICSFLAHWGRRFDTFVTGMLVGYMFGIFVGSAWFLIKEFKKH